ncbi:MAG: DUF799 family lipoprotein [Pontiellaceae bacterium]|nr:DUF799 family lipoprotein [Pontiellaceae bacterium]
MKHGLGLFGISVCIALLCGCVAPRDYTQYYEHFPKSILVIPPLNESTDIRATYSVLSTLTRPLAERGYYVFPVAVVDQFLQENGLPTPGEMHQIPLDKVDSIIGADAVLYVTINDYGTKYLVVDSSTQVSLSARLVDVKTGIQLWEGHADYAESSSGGGNNIIAAMIAAALNQVIADTTDQAHSAAREASAQLISRSGHPLLNGPYHPEFKEDWQ